VYLQTVNGAIPAEQVGLTLPHEHLFTDLRGPSAPGYAQADPEGVARVLAPFLAAAHAAGVRALVECSTVGVGRNLGVLRHLAATTPIHLVAPAGLYRDALIAPAWRDQGAEQLAEAWVCDLSEGIEGTGVRAGFLKLAVSDDGLTSLEVRNLRAAAQASRQTGAAVAVHTVGGALARRVMETLESAGLDLHRFIWVHANLEPNRALHLEAARRGAYVEFDGVGAAWQIQSALVDDAVALIEAGYAGHLLLSHDAGWYDPSQPGGRPEGGFRGFTALAEEFVPALRARGVTADLIRQLTVDNPVGAFALPGGLQMA